MSRPRKIATVGLVNVYRVSETNEYLCRLQGADVGEGYWTDDRADALATAARMDDHAALGYARVNPKDL